MAAACPAVVVTAEREVVVAGAPKEMGGVGLVRTVAEEVAPSSMVETVPTQVGAVAHTSAVAQAAS